MVIVKESVTPRAPGAGRPNKYPFPEMKPGDCIKWPVPASISSKIEARKISTALSLYKSRNAPNWVTAVRNTYSEVSVYRIS